MWAGKNAHSCTKRIVSHECKRRELRGAIDREKEKEDKTLMTTATMIELDLVVGSALVMLVAWVGGHMKNAIAQTEAFNHSY